MKPDEPRQRPGAGYGSERPIGGSNQAPRKSDSFWFITVEKCSVGPPAHHCRELPGQVHGVANAGVHPLSAYRTVNMCRVTEQKRAAFGKMSGNPMVDAVGRKPVHALDVDANPREHACVHVVPRKVLLLFSLLTDCPDEPGLPLSLQWEDDEK